MGGGVQSARAPVAPRLRVLPCVAQVVGHDSSTVSALGILLESASREGPTLPTACPREPGVWGARAGRGWTTPTPRQACQRRAKIDPLLPGGHQRVIFHAASTRRRVARKILRNKYR